MNLKPGTRLNKTNCALISLARHGSQFSFQPIMTAYDMKYGNRDFEILMNFNI